MIYRIFIGLILFCLVLYYIFCFLEVFEVIKFTEEGESVEFPKMLIPFYYLLKKSSKKTEIEGLNKTVTKKKSTKK